MRHDRQLEHEDEGATLRCIEAVVGVRKRPSDTDAVIPDLVRKSSTLTARRLTEAGPVAVPETTCFGLFFPIDSSPRVPFTLSIEGIMLEGEPLSVPVIPFEKGRVRDTGVWTLSG